MVFQLKGAQVEFCVHLEDPPDDGRQKKSVLLQNSCSAHEADKQNESMGNPCLSWIASAAPRQSQRTAAVFLCSSSVADWIFHITQSYHKIS